MHGKDNPDLFLDTQKRRGERKREKENKRVCSQDLVLSWDSALSYPWDLGTCSLESAVFCWSLTIADYKFSWLEGENRRLGEGINSLY